MMQRRMALPPLGDDLESRLLDKLQNSGMPELQRVTAEIKFDRVILQGSVRTYYAKQMAQTFAAKVEGVESVTNNIVVRSGRHLAVPR